MHHSTDGVCDLYISDGSHVECGTTIIDLHCKEWERLTPQLLGPFWVRDVRRTDVYREGVWPGFIPLSNNGIHQIALCRNVSNCMAYSTLYSSDIHHGMVKKEFFERRGYGFSSLNVRHTPRDEPVAIYFDGDVRSLDLRDFYFCHYYSNVVKFQDEFKNLYNIMRNGADSVTLIINNVNDEHNGKHMNEAYLTEKYIDGDMNERNYGLVLASALLNIGVWRRKDPKEIQ